MADEMNAYGGFTQVFVDEGEEKWHCPIAYVGEDELGDHPYAVTTLPGANGHPHHFSTKSLCEWVSENHTNPMTRQYIPGVEQAKLERRFQLLTEFPALNKRVPIDFDSIFSDPAADKSILHGRVEPESFPCFFPFEGVAPSDRREAGKNTLEPLPIGSWLIRKGSIKSVEKAAGTNTPANSYVFMIKVADGYQNIPFIHFFGYGFRICFDFTTGTDLTYRAPPLDDVTNWYFTFADLLTNPYLSTLDLTKSVTL